MHSKPNGAGLARGIIARSYVPLPRCFSLAPPGSVAPNPLVWDLSRSGVGIASLFGPGPAKPGAAGRQIVASRFKVPSVRPDSKRLSASASAFSPTRTQFRVPKFPEF